ncbi:MAG: hypothetical protein JXB43_02415, partial [Dehalococcoidia bacterium]|nr:hypothetical protein [Dehalococcoidia bacterium]
MNRGEVTLDNLRNGLERFNKEQGHYPAAEEIDACPYLPSARQIQRKLGGLKKLRSVLGLNDLDYRTGSRRQVTINEFLQLAVASEKATKEFLDKRYGEICVHEEKKYGEGGSNRVDFFVYAKENFAVEVFNTYSIRNLAKNLNIKLHKFSDFPFRLYFVVTGGDFSQVLIDALISNKKNLPLLPNMKCLTVEEFKKECM